MYQAVGVSREDPLEIIYRGSRRQKRSNAEKDAAALKIQSPALIVEVLRVK